MTAIALPSRIQGMLTTSCDDLKSSVALINNITFLEEVLAACEFKGQKTKVSIVETRIRKIQREAA